MKEIVICPASIPYPNESDIAKENNRIQKKFENSKPSNSKIEQPAPELLIDSPTAEGTYRHKLLELFFKRIPESDYSDTKLWVTNIKEKKAGLEGPINNVKRIVNKLVRKGHKLVNILPEENIFDLQNKIFISGEIDLLLVFNIEEQSKYVLIDWKRSFHPSSDQKNEIQLKIYAQILKNQGHNVHKHGWIVSHKKDNVSKKVPLEHGENLLKHLSDWEQQTLRSSFWDCGLCKRSDSKSNPCLQSACMDIFDIKHDGSSVRFRETGLTKSEWQSLLKNKTITIKKNNHRYEICLDENFDTSIEHSVDWNYYESFDVRGKIKKPTHIMSFDVINIIINPRVFIGLN